jgi:hypothetical protein
MVVSNGGLVFDCLAPNEAEVSKRAGKFLYADGAKTHRRLIALAHHDRGPSIVCGRSHHVRRGTAGGSWPGASLVHGKRAASMGLIIRAWDCMQVFTLGQLDLSLRHNPSCCSESPPAEAR